MMSTGATIAVVIGTVMVLMLNWRALRGHALGRDQMFKMALIWAGIIAVLTLIISQAKL
jgi:hypothetical protein